MVLSVEGLPSGASGKEPACQFRRCKRLGFNPWIYVCAFPDHGMALRGGGRGHSAGKARGGSAAPQRAPYDSRPGPLVP